eukprot:gene13341-biopygen10642
MTGEQVRALDEFRRTVLRRRGYRVFVMKECMWREECRRRDGGSVHAFVEERRRQHEDDPLERNDNWAGYTTQDTLIEALLHGKVHGMVTCDVHVPQERREYFKEFAPIIKHTYVDYADVGEFTQAVTDANGIAIKKRKCIIDLCVGHEITITDEYFDRRREIASMNTYVRYEQVSRQVLEVETKKRRVVYDQPRYIGKMIFDRAKLSVLTFVYDFLKSVLKPDHFELLERDTDSIYLALKEDRFEDNVAEEKRDEYERKKDVYFITDQCEFGKRQPNRYKLEFSGHRIASHDDDEDDDDDKDVSEIIYDIYREGLKTDPNADCKTHAATNRGIKRKQNLMQTYAQEKNMLNSLYCKRRVLEDGMSTIEEILKGTGLGRMKRRMKMEIGHHVANNYVSPFKNLYRKKHIPDYSENIHTAHDCVPRQALIYKKTHPLFGKGQSRLSSKMLREHGLLPDVESGGGGGGGGGGGSVDDDGFVYNQVDPELLYKKKLEVFRHNLSKELLNVITNCNQNKDVEEQNKTDTGQSQSQQQRRISKRTKAKLQLWSDINKTVNKNLQQEHHNDDDGDDCHSEMTTISDNDDDDDDSDQDEQYLHRYADDIEQYYASIAD